MARKVGSSTKWYSRPCWSWPRGFRVVCEIESVRCESSSSSALTRRRLARAARRGDGIEVSGIVHAKAEGCAQFTWRRAARSRTARPGCRRAPCFCAAGSAQKPRPQSSIAAFDGRRVLVRVRPVARPQAPLGVAARDQARDPGDVVVARRPAARAFVRRRDLDPARAGVEQPAERAQRLAVGLDRAHESADVVDHQAARQAAQHRFVQRQLAAVELQVDVPAERRDRRRRCARAPTTAARRRAASCSGRRGRRGRAATGARRARRPAATTTTARASGPSAARAASVQRLSKP